ncbi:MAG: FKBP-type peptidyl-prolyl cis-trans isomerase [Bacteroidota bacterium]
MKQKLMLLAVAAIALTSCGGGFKQGQGGMLYNIQEDKSGPVIKEGDFVSINMIVKTEGDSLLNNTYTSGRPIQTLMPKVQFKGDVVAAIMMLSEGDSATVKVNVDSLAKAGQPKQPGFKGKYIVFQLKVEKVIAKGNLSDEIFKNRVQEYFKTVTEQLKKAEPAKISKYIADNNLKTTKTASGLNYVITKQGNGPTPAIGDTVVLYYTGKLIGAEKPFETNVKEEAMKDKKTYNPMQKYEPIRVPVGEKKVIAGWDEGLLLVNKGAKATFIIPAALAYGEQGMGPIPPFSALIFDVDIVDIIKPNPNAVQPAPPAPQPPVQVKK